LTLQLSAGLALVAIGVKSLLVCLSVYEPESKLDYKIMDPTPTTTDELSPSAFEVLQSAVRIAREQQIQTLPVLRRQLDRIFPSRGEDIEQAIHYWAAWVARTRKFGRDFSTASSVSN
jgi:hypothetical protein